MCSPYRYTAGVPAPDDTSAVSQLLMIVRMLLLLAERRQELPGEIALARIVRQLDQ
jgi:hypothetical protein